ncbi:MAG: SPOR domain-containing protein [Comamonas sp.]|nr:SPOR domain-containing protein [uncultured Comamonas sp.]
MLRFALLVLLVANAGYLAWSQGWMATLGWTPEAQTEPYRLKQQVRPDVLSVVPTPPAAATPPPAASSTSATEPDEEILPETTVCLQSENMDEAQSKKLQQVLQQSDLPSTSWEMQSSAISGRWMVYLGKFPNETALEKRRAELRTRKIGYDRAGGSLEPGLSLGRFSSEDAATRELGQMLNQGVRGARVVQERAPQTLYALRLSHATAAQRSILQRLQPSMGGKALRACAS